MSDYSGLATGALPRNEPSGTGLRVELATVRLP
jgi:hypothetical protein